MRRPFSTSQRWPLVLVGATTDRDALAKSAQKRLVLLASGCAVLAFGALVSAPWMLRIGIAILGVASIVVAAISQLRSRRQADGEASGSFVEADASGLLRVSPEGTKSIVKWDSPIGVCLLASYGRPHALLAFTTPSQTRYVPTRIEPRSEADDEVFARIAVLADLDLVDGVMHDAALRPQDAATLLRHVDTKSKDALGRLYLSDGKGAPIALDRGTLQVGERAFDLTSQLEWRALMFHESTGQAAALYQATWIRQNASEVVLVAPMPASIVPREPNAHREASGRLGRALTRDLRLLQAPAEAPPPRETRVAIDRPFMMAVRRALDDAPLASRISITPAKPRREGRGSVI
jgi:hypothetical protein